MPGMSFGGPGGYLTGNNRFAQLLAQSDPNNGTAAGGAASVLQKALLGYVTGKDSRQSAEANQAFMKGIQGTQWKNPDMGGRALNIREGMPEMGAAPTMSPGAVPPGMGGGVGQIGDQMQPQTTPTFAPTPTGGTPGGYSGAMQALGGLQGNEYAGRLAQQLAMMQMDQDQTAKMLGLKAQLDRQNSQYEWDNKPTTLGQGDRLIRGGATVAENPKGPEYGKDTPYPQNVHDQRVAEAAARKTGWTTVTDPVTGKTYQVSSDGQRAPDPAALKEMTEGQSAAATFADRMSISAPVLESTSMEVATDPKMRALEFVPGGNYFMSPEYRQFSQAKRDFINAALRRESGAVISPSEFDNADLQYFPQPGDDPATVAQKLRNRATVVQGLMRAAGPSYKPQGAGGGTGEPTEPVVKNW